MDPNEVEKYQEFLFDSLETGIKFPEIKLTEKEIQFITNSYPEVSIQKYRHKKAFAGKRRKTTLKQYLQVGKKES
jgi:hypothetical protein